MRIPYKAILPCCILILCLLVSACGNTVPEETNVPAEELSVNAVAGEDSPPPPPPADGLQGYYYNDYLHLTLQLDGRGNAAFTGTKNIVGSYETSDAELLLSFPEETLTAHIDADGDLEIETMVGRFLRDWNFWNITETETGIRPDPIEDVDYQNIPLGDGRMRYRDFENHIAFTYDSSIQVFPGALMGAVAATDGNGGFVSGRNVTDNFRTHTGSANEFLSDYIKTFVFADFNSFYQKLSSFEPVQLLEEGIDGRLASATISIHNESETITVKVILYTSTYADGTENYICKCFFAPEANSDQLRLLSQAVTEMGAIRMVAQ